jgi:hypothetical protein
MLHEFMILDPSQHATITLVDNFLHVLFRGMIKSNRFLRYQVRDNISWNQQRQEQNQATDKGTHPFAMAQSFEHPLIKGIEEPNEHRCQHHRNEENFDHRKEQGRDANEDDHQKIAAEFLRFDTI